MASANWDLPPELLKRQSRRELERAVLELRRSGFSDDQIRAHENELRQNTLSTTARALKEHFILERIAEEEKISDDPQDYENEIRLIAAQSGESVRRVRAQLEKRGLMDILRNQIIERKTIELVLKARQIQGCGVQARIVGDGSRRRSGRRRKRSLTRPFPKPKTRARRSPYANRSSVL